MWCKSPCGEIANRFVTNIFNIQYLNYPNCVALKYSHMPCCLMRFSAILIGRVVTNVTLDHKTSLKSQGYICSNSQKYIEWVKIINFYFMPKIIRKLSKDHVP